MSAEIPCAHVRVPVTPLRLDATSQGTGLFPGVEQLVSGGAAHRGGRRDETSALLLEACERGTALSEALPPLEQDAIEGRGAFRRFRDAVHEEGIADQWYAFSFPVEGTSGSRARVTVPPRGQIFEVRGGQPHAAAPAGWASSKQRCMSPRPAPRPGRVVDKEHLVLGAAWHHHRQAQSLALPLRDEPRIDRRIQKFTAAGNPHLPPQRPQSVVHPPLVGVSHRTDHDLTVHRSMALCPHATEWYRRVRDCTSQRRETHTIGGRSGCAKQCPSAAWLGANVSADPVALPLISKEFV